MSHRLHGLKKSKIRRNAPVDPAHYQELLKIGRSIRYAIGPYRGGDIKSIDAWYARLNTEIKKYHLGMSDQAEVIKITKEPLTAIRRLVKQQKIKTGKRQGDLFKNPGKRGTRDDRRGTRRNPYPGRKGVIMINPLKITKGDIIYLKPKWQDKGDGFMRVARDNETKGRVTVMTIIPGMSIYPTEVIPLHMIDIARIIANGHKKLPKPNPGRPNELALSKAKRPSSLVPRFSFVALIAWAGIVWGMSKLNEQVEITAPIQKV
jgi:hypothetical protein